MVQTTIKVEGMMCGMCEAHVNDAIRRDFKVKNVTSSHSKGETVVVSESSVDENKLREVIEKTGYKVLSVSQEPYEKKGFFSKFKK